MHLFDGPRLFDRLEYEPPFSHNFYCAIEHLKVNPIIMWRGSSSYEKCEIQQQREQLKNKILCIQKPIFLVSIFPTFEIHSYPEGIFF